MSKSWMPTLLGQKATLQAVQRLHILPSQSSRCHNAYEEGRNKRSGTCHTDCSSQDSQSGHATAGLLERAVSHCTSNRHIDALMQ